MATYKKGKDVSFNDSSMLPSLSSLNPGVHERHLFVDVLENVVFSIERRSGSSFALVGVPSDGNIQISAPMVPSAGVMETGTARIKYGTIVGRCSTQLGIAATRAVLAAQHNRGHEVLLVNGYLIGSFQRF